MAHFNNDIHYTRTAPDVFESYPAILHSTLPNDQATPTFADGWAMFDLQPPSDVASTFSDPAAFPGSCWPTDDRPIHMGHSEMAIQGDPFVGGQGWGAVAEGPVYDPVPTVWGFGQYEATTDASYADATPNCPLSGSSTTGTWVRDDRRFEPYGVYQGHSTMSENAEAGPSTQPSPTSHGTWRRRTDVDTNKQLTEEPEEEVTTPTQRQSDQERNYDNIRKLRKWFAARRGTQGIPSHEVAINAAATLITTRRWPVYDEPRLFSQGDCKAKTGGGVKRTEKVYKRKNGTREAYETLSQYYPLKEGCPTWKTRQLLVRVLEDLYALDPPPTGNL